MLISITQQCFEGCSHCQALATPKGEHMDWETWYRVLDFIQEVRPRGIILSGGEPTRHPEIIPILRALAQVEAHTILATNGSYVERDEIRAEINFTIGRHENLHLQVTSDDRYYPNAARRSARLAPYCPVDRILEVRPHGRARDNHPESLDIDRAPTCVNTYLMAKQASDFTGMIRELERHQKLCKPQIDYLGQLRPGEAMDCEVTGHITLGADVLFRRLQRGAPCDRCGLLKNIKDSRVLNILKREIR